MAGSLRISRASPGPRETSRLEVVHEVAAGAEHEVVADRGGGERLAAVVPALHERLAVAVVAARHEVAAGAELAVVADRGGDGGGDLAERWRSMPGSRW